MILHIHSYPSLFINQAITNFELAEIKSFHLVIGKEANKPKNLSENVLYFKEKSAEYFNFFKNELSNYNLALFHCLYNSNLVALADLLKFKPDNLKTAWIIYGAEIQESYLIPSMFLGETTKVMYYKLLPYRVVVPFYRFFLKLIGKNIKLYLDKIDYYVHYMPEDVDWAVEHLGVKKPLLWYTYTILENFIESNIVDKQVVKDGNILIGNSATFTCNHYEIFEHLKNFDFEEKKIIVPLSYGNSAYKKFVLKSGEKFLKQNFAPLTDFLTKDKYQELMLNCSVMILNHQRQQALGNIVSAAWLGMKIYINKSTSSYKFFKRNGLIIFSIEDDLKTENKNIFKSLSDKEILHNRNILKTIYGKENAVSKIRKSFLEF